MSSTAATTSYAESDNPTRPLPTLTLADMMRELDAASAADEESTLMISAEENKRLLADAFVAAPTGGDVSDDEPTLLASVPVLFEPASARPTRPPPLRALVLTSPPPRRAPSASDVPMTPSSPASGTRPRITAEMAKAHRESLAAEAAVQRAPHMATFKIRLPETNAKNLVVAGLWATALSLSALLTFIATSS